MRIKLCNILGCLILPLFSLGQADEAFLEHDSYFRLELSAGVPSQAIGNRSLVNPKELDVTFEKVRNQTFGIGVFTGVSSWSGKYLFTTGIDLSLYLHYPRMKICSYIKLGRTFGDMNYLNIEDVDEFGHITVKPGLTYRYDLSNGNEILAGVLARVATTNFTLVNMKGETEIFRKVRCHYLLSIGYRFKT